MKFLIMILLLLYPITGNTADYHPADTNKDWQISLEEFNAYNTAWRQSETWPDSLNPIPGEYVARAGYLYKKGNCYYEYESTAPMNWESDQDCDRTIDSKDGCSNDPNKIEAGYCGCGKSENDRDKDNTPDCIDKCPDDPNKIKAGVCGCGKAETGDRDNDKTLDCVDLCPDDPNKVKPGICGCGEDENCKFIDNQDGTVIHRTTCLMWQKQTASSEMNWYDAISYCNNLTLAGYSDWRLPTRDELKSIVDKNQAKAPYINTAYFPDTNTSVYWSTSVADYRDYAWGILFRHGHGYEYRKSTAYFVRAVRSGQCR